MSLRINHNIASLNGHRNMVKNDAMVSKSLEKLSSGLKINRAADNAAGLVISEQMRAQLGGIKQAMNNTEQAVTMVQTAEGALDEMNSLLSKVKSLALHALNTGGVGLGPAHGRRLGVQEHPFLDRSYRRPNAFCWSDPAGWNLLHQRGALSGW